MLIAPLVLAAAAPGLVALLPEDKAGRRCLPDRSLCLRLISNDENAQEPAELELAGPASAGSEAPIATMPLPLHTGGRLGLSLWPQAIELPPRADAAPDEKGGLMIGVIEERSVMYSGGGGASQRLHLFELARDYGLGQLMGERLALPLSANLMIRACFTEHDYRDRRGACHDEYSFAAELAPAPDQPAISGWPVLRYSARAQGYPRVANRQKDSAGTRLSKGDLAWADDEQCTYQRSLHYNPASERYEMDSPAPDCSDFTAP